MFTVYHSNQLDILKSLAAYLIENEPLRDPFQSEVVLVQSPAWRSGCKCSWRSSSASPPISPFRCPPPLFGICSCACCPAFPKKAPLINPA